MEFNIQGNAGKPGKYDETAKEIMKNSGATVVCIMVMGNPGDPDDMKARSGMSLCSRDPGAVITFLGALQRCLPEIQKETMDQLVNQIKESVEGFLGETPPRSRGGMDGSVPPPSVPGDSN